MTVPAEPYLPSPTACALLERIVAQSDGSLTKRNREIKIKHGSPIRASDEIRKFFQPQATVKFAPAFFARLPVGRVFGSGNVLSPDGLTIARDVSPDFGKPFEEHWLLTYKRIRPPVLLPGTTAVIATTLGAGYSHWLLEELPRLLALTPHDCETLIAHAGHAYNREAIALHGFTGKVLPAKREAHHSCEQLLVPSLGQLTPSTVRALDEFAAPLRQPSSPFGERLYISREKAKRRRVANETELWVELAAHGFVKLHLEELTWAQQITAFRAAKVIVAPHGAGLANLVFCQPGTKVIELFHRSYVSPLYWQLAALKGLDYRPIVPAGDERLAQNLEANRLDIVADLAQVRRILQTQS